MTTKEEKHKGGLHWKKNEYLCFYCSEHTKTRAKMIKHNEACHSEDWQREYGYQDLEHMTPEAKEFYRTLFKIRMGTTKENSDRIFQFMLSCGMPLGSPVSTDIPKWIMDMRTKK